MAPSGSPWGERKAPTKPPPVGEASFALGAPCPPKWGESDGRDWLCAGLPPQGG